MAPAEERRNLRRFMPAESILKPFYHGKRFQTLYPSLKNLRHELSVTFRLYPKHPMEIIAEGKRDNDLEQGQDAVVFNPESLNGEPPIFNASMMMLPQMFSQ